MSRRARLLASLAAALCVPPVMAATFPSDSRVEFQTSGCQRPATVGDWYTSSATSSTVHYGDFFLEVTETMAPATVEILDADSTDGAGSLCDEVDGTGCDGTASGTGDPTRFELRSGDGAALLQGVTVPSGSANGTSVSFSGLAVGLYRIRSYTGSDEIDGASCGTNATADNNDDNSFQVRVNGNAAIDGLLGFLQTTYQQETGSSIDYQMYFIVGPALANSTLALRNFDLDGGASGTVYNRPPDASGSSVSGTVSGNGRWNNGGSLNAGEDSVGVSNKISGSTADVGSWGYRISGWTSGNQTIFEAADAGVKFPLTDSIPTRAGFFTVTPDDSKATTTGVAVDHPFTVTNLFFTADVIDFTLSGTSTGYTVQLRSDLNCDGDSSDGAALTDLDGDGLPDTGLLSPTGTAGASACFVLRTTADASATTLDTTRISAVSFMDKKVVPASNTTRFVDKTTTLPPSIAAAFSPSPVAGGSNATVTFTLSNPNPLAVALGTTATAYAFTDAFPVAPGAMTLASTTTTNTCGGALTDDTGGSVGAGDTGIRYSGGTIPANGSCTVSVQVTATVAGDYVNPSSALTTTTFGSGNTASATLTVEAVPVITVSAAAVVISDPLHGAASPLAIPGAVIEYTLSVANAAGSTAATSVTIADAIPASTTYAAGSLKVNGAAEDDGNSGADETDPDGADFGLTTVNTVTARIGAIAGGTTATVVYRVTIN